LDEPEFCPVRKQARGTETERNASNECINPC
jgi:hypothetical protein